LVFSLTVAGKVSRAKAPDHTYQEPEYLRELIAKSSRVCIRMDDGQQFEGVIEFFDATFIRLTRTGEPNLFLFKQDIKYLFEAGK
jgi:sRNA-binding regulator protein Hfq